MKELRSTFAKKQFIPLMWNTSQEDNNKLSKGVHRLFYYRKKWSFFLRIRENYKRNKIRYE